MAGNALQQGRIIAYPTESVYGLGCDPYNEIAALQLLSLKQRPMYKGLILIAADISQLSPFIQADEAILNRISPSWPGPITWVIPAQSWVPEYLKGQHSSLAVRVSAHPVVQQLCKQFGGAIISTSANISQQKPARSALVVRQYFSANEVFVLSGQTSQLQQPTAIYDAQSGQCLRSA
ncbi:MAG: tRNA threonylcarbamoyladenosine biosynthesis protein RimN [Methyloprofundus sp.]|nr:tRNA threonylcarbamoyladenosine biosynthesis protein RimN [Methyloprofundus sp.]